MNFQTLINIGITVGVGYGLYKLNSWANVAEEEAVKAHVKIIELVDGKAELTPSALSSRDDYVARGYMVKSYVPFYGCVGDSCYRYDITPEGKAYINEHNK